MLYVGTCPGGVEGASGSQVSCCRPLLIQFVHISIGNSVLSSHHCIQDLQDIKAKVWLQICVIFRIGTMYICVFVYACMYMCV